MEELSSYFALVSDNCLFSGISRERIIPILEKLSVRIRQYENSEQVFYKGTPVNELGVLLSGTLAMQQYDIDGHRTLLLKREKGGLVAVSALTVMKWQPPADIFAIEPCTILYIQGSRFNSLREIFPDEAGIILQNAMSYASAQNARMMEHLSILGMRSIRSKLSAFLCLISEKQGGTRFEIPYSRQELADYLAVDRCALSKEMKKMSNEGLICFNGKYFDITELMSKLHPII